MLTFVTRNVIIRTLSTDITAPEITGSDAAGLFDPQSEEIFRDGDERTLLAGLLSLNDRVDVALPDGMPASELWRTFDLCARVFVRVRYASGQLKLLIGRALSVIQDTPEIYESRGFSSFDGFMSDETRGLPKITGISRAELYKAKSVAKSVGPGMNLEDARQIGFSKMQLIAGVSNAGEATFNTLVDAAKTDTIPQLRERIARQGLVGSAADLEWDVLQVNMTRTQKRVVQQFLQNPQVRAYCETESAGTILERAIAEVTSEWEIQAMAIEGKAQEL